MWVARKVSIPPLSESIVPVCVQVLPSCTWGILESDDRAQALNHMDGILVGRTLVNVQNEILPLRVMNVTQTPKTIAGGSMIAKCDMTCDVSIPAVEVEGMDDECFTARAAATTDLPSHLEPL